MQKVAINTFNRNLFLRQNPAKKEELSFFLKLKQENILEIFDIL